MAFVKTGDAQPIIGSYDENEEPNICPKCGRPMTTIALGPNGNSFVCDCVEEADEE